MSENINYHLDRHFFDAPRRFGNVSLYQIGRLYSNSKTKMAAHAHGNYYELTVVTDGCGVITTNGTPVKVTRGDIYLSFPSDTHKIDTDSKNPLKFDFFAFNTEDEGITEALEKIMLEHRGAEQRVFGDERVSFLVSNAISELDADEYATNKLLECMLYQIIVYTVRSFIDKIPRSRPERMTSNEILCYKMMNYIDTHIYSMSMLSEMADAMGYSYGYLSSLYKKTTAVTLAEYYRNKRLEIARLLVLEGRTKIGDIAERLNYASVYAFSKAFKNKFGISPEKYKKKKPEK